MNRKLFIVLAVMCAWMTACTTTEPVKPAKANPPPQAAATQPKTAAKAKPRKFRMPVLSHPDSW
ncbi:MAG: hypothetical protein IJH79_05570, partial [Lentisphaeria bacterium]|nr:hypothetical protein [Lentisphaeria bacterium]